MNNNITEYEVNGVVVEIKSRRDEAQISGWSTIAFTPDISIRCTKLHRKSSMTAFATAILASCGSDEAPDDLVAAIEYTMQ